MSDTEETDPRKIIAAFLSGLPVTIRTEALLFVILYAAGIDPPNDKNQFEGTVLNYLTTSGIEAISAVICAAAVIDFSLERFVSKAGFADAAFKKMRDQFPQNPALQQAHLSLPLRQRHWEQALAEWKTLRTTKLTPQKLRDFEDSQLNPLLQR
jgi:hypothetical protein